MADDAPKFRAHGIRARFALMDAAPEMLALLREVHETSRAGGPAMDRELYARIAALIARFP